MASALQIASRMSGLFPLTKGYPSFKRRGTFVCNHAAALLAMDFVVVRTLLGGIRYLHLVMEVGSRRIVTSKSPRFRWWNGPRSNSVTRYLRRRSGSFRKLLIEYSAAVAIDLHAIASPRICKNLLSTHIERYKSILYLRKLGDPHDTSVWLDPLEIRECWWRVI